MTIQTLRELKRESNLKPAMVRLPPTVISEVVRFVARHNAGKPKSEHIKASDVYRTAVLSFLPEISTDSRDSQKPESLTND